MLAEIREAQTAFASGDTARAVQLLVEVWRRVPSPRIAEVAAKLSARLPTEQLPEKVGDRDARWLELAALRDRAQLPTLLAAEWPVHPRGAKQRIIELIEIGADPRTVVALHELWQARRYRVNRGYGLWEIAFRALLAWGDPVAAEYTDHARAERGIEWAAVFVRIADLAKPPPPPLDAETEQALAALASELDGHRVDGRTLDSLFDAVYADPSSDAPRLVLADALLAAGDPLGEFIQLQLAPATGRTEKRITALVRAHGGKWLGGIATLVREPVFRRGFVAEVELVEADDLEPEERAWCTVDTVRLDRWYGDASILRAFLAHPHLGAVRCLHGMPVEALHGLARDLDQLTINALLGRLGPLAAPDLHAREVALYAETTGRHPGLDESFRWLATEGASLTASAVVVHAPAHHLLHAWQLLQQSTLDQLTLRPMYVDGKPMSWELRLDRRGALEAIWHDHGHRDRSGLGVGLVDLPADALTSLVVRCAGKLGPGRETVTQLEQASQHQRRLATREIFSSRSDDAGTRRRGSGGEAPAVLRRR